jgi:hypothetical protein
MSSFLNQNAAQAEIFNCKKVRIFIYLLFFKAYGYFNDIVLQKSLLFKKIHDFLTLSLAESNNKKVYSAGDLQNVEQNFSAYILCKLNSVKNMLKEKSYSEFCTHEI